MARSVVFITALAMLAAFLPGLRHHVPAVVVPAGHALTAPAEEHAPRETREAPPTRPGTLPDQREGGPDRSARAVVKVVARVAPWAQCRSAVGEAEPRAPAGAVWTSPCALQVFRH